MFALIIFMIQDGIEFKADLDDALKSAKEKKRAALIYFAQPG